MRVNTQSKTITLQYRPYSQDDASPLTKEIPYTTSPIDFIPFFRNVHYLLGLDDDVVMKRTLKSDYSDDNPLAISKDTRYNELPDNVPEVKAVNESNILAAQLMFGLPDPRKLSCNTDFGLAIARVLELINFYFESERREREYRVLSQDTISLNNRRLEVLGAVYSMYHALK